VSLEWFPKIHSSFSRLPWRKPCLWAAFLIGPAADGPADSDGKVEKTWQRVMIARALAQTPRVLLLDEPTAFLDLQHQVGICSVLLCLKKERRLTVVLVSHDLNLVSQYCDRILLLDRGQVVRLGRPEEVIEPGVLESVYRCRVLVDGHPGTGLPRVTLPGRSLSGGM
jgi:iron complex transport system ATP-binding protein